MTEEQHPKTPEEEAAFLERLEDQIRRMSVADHLVYMMESLAALSARKLGLTSETAAERDLDQARLSIEAFRVLLQVVEPERPMGEINAHRGMLSELQLAYVKALEVPADVADPDEGDETEQAPADCEPYDGVVSGDLDGLEDGTLPLEE